MDFSTIVTKTSQILSDNAPTILSGIAATTTVATAIFSAQGSFKAAKLLASEERRRELETVKPEPLTTKEKIELVWPCYVPAATTGVVSVTCIILANRIGSRRAAAMAAAYAMSRDAFAEYKDKVVEKLGERKESKLRDELAEDQIRRNPNTREIIISGPNEVMCYDSITGRYFKSNVESLRKAENDINREINQGVYASLSDFYSLVGLPRTPYSDEVGWNHNYVFELQFSTVLSEDGTPCISINYEPYPIRDFY